MKTNRIAACLLAGALTSGFLACKKSDSPSLPPIGGYNSSNDIAPTNLLAHFPFNGSYNERLSNTPGTGVNASFTTGASGQGQALNLSSGYVAYPALPTLTPTSLPSFTVSAWVNVKNNGKAPSSFVSIARAGEWAGSVNLLAETGQRQAVSDTLFIKGLLVQKAADGNATFQDNVTSPEKGGDQAFKAAGKWSHVVFVYDASTSKITLYGNGKKINNPDYENRTYNGNPLGNMNLFPVTNVVIGAWGTNLPGGTPDSWQQPMTGSIDEVRIYSKALSPGDINSLYQLEAAGR
jgi:hypothetical protein